MKSNNVSTLYQYSILLIAFLTPSAFYGANLGVLAIVFLCWFFMDDYKRLLVQWKRPQILLPALFYFYIAGGIFFTSHVGDALSTLSTRISFLLFPLIIGSSSIINKNLLKQAATWFIFSTCFFLIFAVSYAAFDVLKTHETTIFLENGIYGYNKFNSFGLTRVFNNWHPTNVSVCVNLAIALLLQQKMESGKTEKKTIILTVSIFLFLSFCVFLLNSINGIIVYAFILLFFSFKLIERFKHKLLIKISLIIALIFAGFSTFYFNPLKNEKIESLKSREFKITDREGERNLLTIRLAKWDAHFKIIRQHWLLGTTAGDIKYVRKQKYQELGYDNLAQLNYNAHNQYIEVFATHGLIGLILFISFLLIPLFQNHKLYYLPFLLITSITFLTESLLLRQQGILFFMFFYSLFTHPNLIKRSTKTA
jgi:O-antigen ligase